MSTVNLGVGAKVSTKFSGVKTTHKIVKRQEERNCQSGVMFQVAPSVPKSSGGWVCSSWFESEDAS